MSIFSIGYETAREEKQKAEERREEYGKKLWEFFLAKDGDEAPINVLNALPVNWNRHIIREFKNGREVYSSYVCTGQPDCPGCVEDGNPSYVGTFLVLDRRETESDGKVYKDQLRIYTQGVRVTSNLDRIHSNYGGLNNWRIIISRVGEGTSTTYNIERDREERITEKQFVGLMNEGMRDSYLKFKRQAEQELSTRQPNYTQDEAVERAIQLLIQDQLTSFYMFPEVAKEQEQAAPSYNTETVATPPAAPSVNVGSKPRVSIPTVRK